MQVLKKFNKRIQQKTRRSAEMRENEIWTTFTYHSPKIRAVTNQPIQEHKHKNSI